MAAELKVKLKDGNLALLKNTSPETIKIIKEYRPNEKEFVFEGYLEKDKEFFEVDARDIEEISAET